MNRYDMMRGQSRSGSKGQKGSNIDLSEVRAAIRRDDRVGELLRGQQSPFQSPNSTKTTKV
jgi:hypothetical protein